jgi:hypothetical protein
MFDCAKVIACLIHCLTFWVILLQPSRVTVQDQAAIKGSLAGSPAGGQPRLHLQGKRAAEGVVLVKDTGLEAGGLQRLPIQPSDVRHRQVRQGQLRL